mgnify:CR=1 FL=1
MPLTSKEKNVILNYRLKDTRIVKILKMENLKIQDWRPRVYHKTRDITPRMWNKNRNWVLKRDGYRCMMCDIKEHLSVHHIEAREIGGKTTPENLISLCDRCHNIAELEVLTKEQILGYYVKDSVTGKPIAPRNDWHMWVYGGFSSPQSNMEKSTRFR